MLVGLGHSDGDGLFHQHLAAGRQAVPDHGKVLGGGDGHTHRRHLGQKLAIVDKVLGLHGVGHLAGLIPVQVGHAHQLGFGQCGILFRMETAQITNANYAHFHRFGHRSTRSQE
jgi:hypothetical protein